MVPSAVTAVASYPITGQNDRDDIIVGREDGTVSIFSFNSQHDEDPPEEVFSTVSGHALRTMPCEP